MVGRKKSDFSRFKGWGGSPYVPTKFIEPIEPIKPIKSI